MPPVVYVEYIGPPTLGTPPEDSGLILPGAVGVIMHVGLDGWSDSPEGVPITVRFTHQALYDHGDPQMVSPPEDRPHSHDCAYPTWDTTLPAHLLRVRTPR